MRKIIDIRTDAMLTQKEFATALGVSLGAVQSWEQETAGISLRYARKIVEFCKAKHIKYKD